MNIIQKTFLCTNPAALSEKTSRFEVSAWQGMGSDTVNIRLRDDFSGWYNLIDVEKLSSYAAWGVKSMDDLIEYLFYVVKA